MKKNIAVVLGTRPEGIKLAPLVKRLRGVQEFETQVLSTGQHREMLAQVWGAFDLEPDLDLRLMNSGASLARMQASVMQELDTVFAADAPDCVVVQGDTLTAYSAGLVAFYRNIPVVHVEAGLRTGNMRSPFPEEFNRVSLASLASLHLAPTHWAKDNLLSEGIAEEKIHVTGNTSIDALYAMLGGRRSSDAASRTRRLLITAHRRENLGLAHRALFGAVLDVLDEFDDLRVLFPAHLNPAVRAELIELVAHPRVELVDPLPYPEFCEALTESYVILTDSGGIQEEAAGLSVPVLVARDTTERPEAIWAGTAKLVGTERSTVREALCSVLGDESVYGSMRSARNPFGDGEAAPRCVAAIAELLGVGKRLSEFPKM